MLKNQYENAVLLLAVFICGAIVMIFEVLASRILGPYLGTLFYTWTSNIGVIMASLSLGYYVGGKLADRKADLDSLSLIILFSALTLFLTVLIKPAVLEMVRLVNWGIELESLTAASLLFILPSFFLAMITPFSVRIKLASVSNSARTVGELYALSTLGSICGTFLAGFLLIPFLGTALLLHLLIIVLVALKGRDMFAEKAADFSGLSEDLAKMLGRQIDISRVPGFLDNPLILTDDYAPVEYFKYKGL